MPVTPRTPLGASTSNHKWFFDVAPVPESGEPVWVPLRGITEVTPGGIEPQLQDDSDFDSPGWGSQINTRNQWSIEGKVSRKVKPGSTPPVYDDGQELIREAGASTGLGNVIAVRWYEMLPDGPRVMAYQGTAAVTYTPDGGDTTAIDTASFTLTGRGARIATDHPDVAGQVEQPEGGA
jgi:hypothetical protein